MRRIIILALAGVLGGCAGSVIKDHMDAMIGLPARAAFDRLGMPDRDLNVAGRHAYVWEWNRFAPEGGEICTIRVFVDASDVIRRYDWKGNETGCEIYAGKLSGW